MPGEYPAGGRHLCVFSGNVSNLQDHFWSDINQDVEFIFGKQYTIQYFNLNILFVCVPIRIVEIAGGLNPFCQMDSGKDNFVVRQTGFIVLIWPSNCNSRKMLNYSS